MTDVLTSEEIDKIYTRDLRRASVAYDAMIRNAWNARAARIEAAETARTPCSTSDALKFLADEGQKCDALEAALRETARVKGKGFSAWDSGAMDQTSGSRLPATEDTA